MQPVANSGIEANWRTVAVQRVLRTASQRCTATRRPSTLPRVTKAQTRIRATVALQTRFVIGALALACFECNNSSSSVPANTAVPGTPAPIESRAAGAPPSASSRLAGGSEARSTKAAGSWVRAFDDDRAGGPPIGFSFGRTGKGAPGRWIVQPDPSTPAAGNVLAQLDEDDTNFRFPVAVLDEPKLADINLSVRCKAVSGRVDQACGIVVRYQDENNYYITRANALEGNIRLYTVRDGSRDEIASHSIEVTRNDWHAYRLELRGDHFQVFWDDHRVLDHNDETFRQAGRVGLWTKADSVTYFDDLRVEAR